MFLDLERLLAIATELDSKGRLGPNYELVNNLARPFDHIQVKAHELLAKERGIEPAKLPWVRGTLHDLRRTYGTRMAPSIVGFWHAMTYDTVRHENLLWGQQLGTSGDEEANGAAPADAGGVYVVGHTRGSLGQPNAGLSDAFVARYDSVGQQDWIVQFGTVTYDSAWAAAVDGSGEVYVAGSTNGNLGGVPRGSNDALIAHLGASSAERVYAAAPDGARGVLVAGTTGGTLAEHNPSGFGDSWFARYGPLCFGDFNADGALDSQDFFDYLAAFFVAEPPADFNHDGAVNSQDIFDFLAAFFAGCS